MDTQATVDTLVDADVLEVANDRNEYQITAPFQDAAEACCGELAALSSDELRERLQGVFEDEALVALVANVGDDDREFVATCEALAERLDAADDTIVRTAPVLQQFRHGMPRAEGAPEAFLPVHGDQLQRFTRLFSRSVVYVWRGDCEPCDAMREAFDELFETLPDDLELFAVYGPDYAPALSDAFDVVGGPTTLFVREGRVESRLQGAHHPETVESEIELLREE